MGDGLFGNTRDKMAEYERMLCDRNDDDWFISDCNLDYIRITEYMMYELECNEVLMENAE